MKVTYRSNNSGGKWWLSDDDWQKLEAAGWHVEWEEDRWLGALATTASKDFDTVKDALEDFENVTGQSVTDEGCNCCGAPHGFSWDGGYASGEDCIEHLFGKDAPRSLREALERG